MALTPQNNEAFLREVDEEYRREQMIGAWQRYGRWIVVAVVALLVAFAGFLFWQHRERVAAEKEGETLQTAYDYLGANDFNGAAKPLAELAQSSRDGYRVLALFSQADVLLSKNDLKGAAAKFAGVANDAGVAKPFRDLGLIRQTAAEYDTLKPDVVIQRLSPLAVQGNAFMGSAGEMVGAAYLAQGKRDLAAQTFARVARDKTVPASLRQRAVQMAGVLGVDGLPQDIAASRGMTE
ncbi:tetratricopeptide repeat protein [Sphingomonas sp. Mn802worker]|uniref:tetratricopeptide repeat protein n=1 Tax=Sphingomonas sp. Mn802worker TaxID=629773 RepID=UPI000377A0C4|nr:tetratricopeptide repeat protein [Sphingomonas sp. Mn802worker]